MKYKTLYFLGEAESARWKKMFDDIQERRQNSRRKNQWGGGRGGHGGGRGGQGVGMSRNQMKGRYGHRPSKVIYVSHQMLYLISS